MTDKTVTPFDSPPTSLIERAKAMILTPRLEWPVIAAESGGIGNILKSYALPLAAIGPVAGLIGGQLFGYGAFGFHYRPSLVAGISTAVTTFVLSIVSLFVMMIVVEFLAPKFDGTANRLRAFRLVAYAMTASWLAGIFGIIPSLAWLGIVGLYSFYIFYTGVTPMMNVPAAKAMTFTIVSVICAIVLSLVVGVVAAAVTGMFTSPASLRDAGEVSGEVNIPGVGKIDMAKMQEATRKAEAAANGTVKAAAPAALQALLPATVAGYSRVSVQSAALGQAGSNAEGRYEKDGKSFTLSVTDMSAMGAIASMGAAMGISANREDADGYDKTQTVDGRIISEKWSKSGGSGEYGTTIAERFMVKAEGQVDSIDTLKGAVAAIDTSALAALSK